MDRRPSNRTSWRGSARRPRHNYLDAARSSKPCRHFLNGSCKFGSRCRFEHEVEHADGPELPDARSVELAEYDALERERYYDWKSTISRAPFPSAEANMPTLRAIWSGALTILDSNNREWHQQFARDVIDDKFYGCHYLHLTLKVSAAANGYLELIDNFLRAITHTAILDCLTVDTYVGTMYNIISGAQGERVVAFLLRCIHGLLQGSDSLSNPVHLTRFDRCLVAMLEALYQLLAREKRVSFNDDLTELFGQLDQMFHALETATDASGHAYFARSDKVDRLRRMVGLSTDLLAAETEGHRPTVTHSASAAWAVYPIEMPAPGGRHDNDRMDISQISIIPTAAEISSEQPDYLPSTDYRHPHFHSDPIRRYTDTHFRLLRHDVFGPLKDVLSPMMDSVQHGSTHPWRADQESNAHLYQNASFAHISVHEKRGFEVHVTFHLPQHLRKKSAEDRHRWWENSKRLEPGGLICLLCSHAQKAEPLFLVVSEKCVPSPERPRPSSETHTETIIARLASLTQETFRLSAQIYRTRATGLLVSIPRLIPATFTPILQQLQNASAAGELPFYEWIIPDARLVRTATTTDSTACPMPPRYARSPGFSFAVDPIATDKRRGFCVEATASPDDDSLLDELETRTSLDRGQCRALVCALTREFALVQGPPGTGKSYLGVQLIQMLLGSKAAAGLGPIIVICYTNHALDQFLLHLLQVGIRKIIRIGGQSRSPELDGFNLRNVSGNVHKTRHENYLLGSTYSNLEDTLDAAGKKLATLHKMRNGASSEALKRFLQRRHPRVHDQFYETDDGFTMVGKDPIKVWLSPKALCTGRGISTDADDGVSGLLTSKAEKDIHSLTQAERKALSDQWLDEMERDEVEHLFMEVEHSEQLRQTVNAVHNEVNRRTLLTADVVGITTTGLARDVGTLRKLRSKVVVCEEAAEVLEAHLISALMPGIEHIIQIGDHQQLRPQINNHSLSLESAKGQPYQLDRSQFERLAIGQHGLRALPVAQLNVQRRMRPEIGSLIRTTMYPHLTNHNSVLDSPDVAGMRNNVFWLDHTKPEDASTDDGRLKSHSNEWEVSMTAALVRHLVRQGAYKSEDIAVLTPYSGQLQKLRTKLSTDFDISLSDRDEDELALKGFEPDTGGRVPPRGSTIRKERLIESLRLATVDNFQGEEAKVVIVSLVRSNREGRVGFLKTKNRVNVLLSRAQHGLYLIGNADTYSNVPMWVDVRRQLDEAGGIGRAFNLCCPRHKDTFIQCAEPDDFARQSPEGGCSLPCQWRLDKCGHQCLAKCHSTAMHQAFLCPCPCPRRRVTCDHGCTKLCGEECGPCKVMVDDVHLPCGHNKNGVPCFRAQEPGHIQCKVEVQKEVPGCGHVVAVPCCKDVGSEAFLCSEPCQQILGCGHQCPGSCGTCNEPKADSDEENGHQNCKKQCSRPRNTCSHFCRRPCHDGDACPPCPNPCEVRCSHSQCSLTCADMCAPCIEKCVWSCDHQGACSMPCAAPCNRLPCNERCSKKLGCGHRCPGLCGETCPGDYCQSCSSRGDDRVDLLEFKLYKDISLDETPIVVLSCGHFFTAESLDGLVRLREVYVTDDHDNYTGCLEPTTVLPVPLCPDCKRPIKQYATQRYNRVVNEAVMDEMLKKFVVKGQTELQQLEQHIESVAKSLRASRTDLPEASQDHDSPTRMSSLPERIRRHRLKTRYRELEQLEKRAENFCRVMGIEQQPSKRLFDAILEAKVRQPLDSRLLALTIDDLHTPALECRALLGGRLACLRIKAISLQDRISLLAETQYMEISRLAKAFFEDCELFVEESASKALPKFAVMGSLTYALVARSLQASNTCRAHNLEMVDTCIATGRRLLDDANATCDTPFRGSKQLKEDIEAIKNLLGSQWYESVSGEELAAIKSAMVSGPEGIATHSGHWYKCWNGHVFAIGDCGMPMELARCPECGAQIGGRNHQMVSGMSRAEHMEG